ncbi:MAG: F0F1 ATP synthase subunit delta [Candidatus Pacebacteria bacterium]|nr:F0F1 ATP synthase subunit delta [Candidatus Paceibacterota bacterium]PIR60624.1 MAG: hypothetical protein COU67_01575 [Candidatus Pacebacteria bacterium CG10_big_fil_rev_8_21_14_0_10_44_54]
MSKNKAVTIVTPQAVSDAQKKSLVALLQQKVGKVTPKFLVDPAIIGGLTITIDGQTIDGSIIGEIKKLHSQLPIVSVVTAVELTTAERKKIEEIVDKKVGPAEYNIVVDPSVLGGIKIVLDNQEYDGTLKGKLQTLRQVLLKKIAT